MTAQASPFPDYTPEQAEEVLRECEQLRQSINRLCKHARACLKPQLHVVGGRSKKKKK